MSGWGAWGLCRVSPEIKIQSVKVDGAARPAGWLADPDQNFSKPAHTSKVHSLPNSSPLMKLTVRYQWPVVVEYITHNWGWAQSLADIS